MKNILTVIVGAVIFTICAVHTIPSTEPASTVQWWTYGMFGGLFIAAIGIHNLKKNDSD